MTPDMITDNLAIAQDKIRALGKVADAARSLTETINKNGDWDDGCFYYNGIAAPEIQHHLRDLQLLQSAII